MSLQGTEGKIGARSEEAYVGLTSKEVAERVSAGKVNTNTDDCGAQFYALQHS